MAALEDVWADPRSEEAMSETQRGAAIVIFGLTYLLIAARRLPWFPLGRPGGTLVGAVLMVAIGVISPKESYAAIDHDTIVLLFGMMLLTAYLRRAGFFHWLAGAVLAACKTPWWLLVAVSLFSAALSAWLVNDTICLFLTPVVVTICLRAGLPMGPYLIALATSSNLGSAATLVGNPQNMIIGSMSQIPFATFLQYAGPAAGVGVAVNLALLWVYYHRQLSTELRLEPERRVILDRSRLVLIVVVLAGILAAFFAGLHLGYSTLAGVTVLVLADRRDPHEIFREVDWPLLVFFCSLFVVMAGLAATGLTAEAWSAAAPHLDLREAKGIWGFTGVMTLGSNLFSNVPMVVLTGPHLAELGSEQLGWVLLGFITTVAGNLTLVGSVANIIVAELAGRHYTLGFREYLRFGFVSTLLVLAVGVPIICWRMAP
jgi:Na+/H+ antiporter NhaD/arsenite permease-like protein